MSTPARGLQNTQPTPSARILSEDKIPNFLAEFNDLVSKRAYELFEQYGRTDGDDLSHWLEAENELATSLPDIRETADSFAVKVPLSGMAAAKVEVCATAERAIISAAENRGGSSDGPIHESQSLYYTIRWPENVDPASCTAQIEDGILTVTAHKA